MVTPLGHPAARPAFAGDPFEDGETGGSLRTDQIRLASKFELMPLANAVVAGVVALVIYGTVPTTALVAWLALSWAATLALVLLFRSLRPASVSSSTVETTARLMTIGAGITGLLWGGAAIVVVGTQPVILHAFIAFVIAGMTAGALMVSASYLPAFLAYALPATLLLAGAYVAAGDAPHFAMAGMTVLYLVFSLGIGAKWSSSIRETLGLHHQLAASRQRFRDFAEAASDWYYEFDASLAVDPAVAEDQSDQAVFLRHLLHDVKAADGAEADDAAGKIRDAIDARRPFREVVYSFTDADGRDRWVRLSGKPISRGGTDFAGYRGVVSDITERMKQDQIMDRERDLLEVVATGASLSAQLDEVALWLEGAIPASRCLILLLEGEARLKLGAAPSLASAYVEAVTGRDHGSDESAFAEAVRSKELVVSGEIETDPIWRGLREATLSHGLRSCWSRPIVSETGAVLGTVSVYKPEPARPAGAEPTYLEVATNVLQIAIERYQTEEALKRSNRLEAIGQLTGGVAHEFNNLLQVFVNRLEEIEALLAGDQAHIRDRIERLVDICFKGRDLTQKLLSFVGARPVSAENVSVADVLTDAVDLLQPTLKKNVAIETFVVPDVWTVRANPNEFVAAIMNLVLNSRDAMPDGGKIEIRAENHDVERDLVLRNGDVVKSGPYVVVSVTDNGTGVAADKIDYIFEPFFTSKEAGKGTGLGLSMVYGFVRHQAAGFIDVESTLGQGTTFRLYFPRHEGPIAAGRASRRSRAQPKRSEISILIVEDQPEIRSGLETLLKALGFAVRSTGTGREALGLIEDGLEVDVLLTDILLEAEMSGFKLSEAALERRPALKILFMTGYSQDELAKFGVREESWPLLQKPFRSEELEASINEVFRRAD